MLTATTISANAQSGTIGVGSGGPTIGGGTIGVGGGTIGFGGNPGAGNGNSGTGGLGGFGGLGNLGGTGTINGNQFGLTTGNGGFNFTMGGYSIGFGANGFYAGAAALACSQDASLGQSMCNVVSSVRTVPGLISGIAYLIGLLFAVSAVLKIKEHVENPNQVSIWEPAKRFIAGGALLMLPMITEAAYTTIAGDGGLNIGITTAGISASFGAGSYNYSGFAGQTTGAGLDAMLVAMMRDIWQPMHMLFEAFAYIAGLILTVIGITRLVKSSQDGARGPGGIGTIVTFLTAGALFSVDHLMGALSTSMFGSNIIATTAQIMYDDGTQAFQQQTQHVTAIISAILAFVALVGWVSFIRGWFLVRDVAEGNQQASLMAALTHIFGGALAVNLGPLLNAIQVTFGLLGAGVYFT